MPKVNDNCTKNGTIINQIGIIAQNVLTIKWRERNNILMFNDLLQITHGEVIW